ncbi:Major facilitator superfamily transporter [Mycena sanguinolenta]|uniref:Major facilitator superfamily transporter n=1 Tax=Mycena sanguinolenta TaxID=230812 RepID=A0A8H6ZEY9_9AGAR|nr:Major facilitator superfamily transporter [Mycena sanguinolenta]
MSVLSSQTASPTPTLREPPEAKSCVEKTEKSYDADGVRDGENRIELKLIFIMMFAYLLAALDGVMTPNLVPKIADQFHSLGDVGWYSSAYLLAGASQLLFGTLYSILPVKWVYLGHILSALSDPYLEVYVGTICIFDLGSLICGVSPTSTALIIGRAIVGLGAAGIGAGTWIIVSRIVPMQRRPLYVGAFATGSGIISVVGPLLGGVFADKLSWRWRVAYYVDSIIGGLTLLMVTIFFNSQALKRKSKSVSLRDCIKLFGPLVIFIPGITSLLLALNWGGSKYPWKSGVEIALFILSGVLISIFIALQVWKKDQATIPPRIVMQRSIFAGVAFLIALNGSSNIILNYMPIYFQAIKGVAATNSAIDNLPRKVALIPGYIIGGVAVTAIGYYTPFVILSSILTTLGTALLSTLTVHSRPNHWIVFQAIHGFGYGIGSHQALVAAQTVLKPEDIPLATSLLIFFPALGDSVFISVAQNVFTNRLRADLISQVPAVNPAVVLDSGAKSLRSAVDPKLLPAVLGVYNEALVSAFHVAFALACFSFIGAFVMEWKSVKLKAAQKQA